MLRSVTRDETFSEEELSLAHRLHAAGLQRTWVPGDRLIGGSPPVRVVRSVSVDGEPLVEVERGGRVQTVGVAQPRIWLPTVADALELLDNLGCEGALMFRAERYGLKYRLADSGAEYQLITGTAPRTVCYRALLAMLESGANFGTVPAAESAAPSES